MRHLKLIAVALPLLALPACGGDDGPRVVQMCADRAGNYLPDYMCDSPTGIYPQAVPYYMPYSAWHDTVEVHHHHYVAGQRITGGSTTRPTTARVQSASKPGKVTVYSSGKQVKVQTSKKTNSFGTVTKKQASTPKYGSYTGSKPKSGKCC